MIGLVIYQGEGSAQTIPFECWTTERINQILTFMPRETDYVDALTSGVIPDTEAISLNCLPNMACWSMETKSNHIKLNQTKPNIYIPLEILLNRS